MLDDAGEIAESLDLREDGDPLDPTAAQFRDAVPAFHGCSHDGEAKGQLVYANYGTQEDYDEVEAAGTNLTGKIVICRYGGLYRGLKVRLNSTFLSFRPYHSCRLRVPKNEGQLGY